MDAEFELDLTGEQPLELGMEEIQVVSSDDYGSLRNKPSIEGVTLEGDKSFADLHLERITDSIIWDM